MVLPTEGGEHFVKKIIKIMKERVCRALNAQRKQQMAWEFDKQTNAIHRILFLDWALEAKNAQVVGHNEIFHKLMERKKKPNRTNKGATGTGKVMKIAVLPSSLGSKE